MRSVIVMIVALLFIPVISSAATCEGFAYDANTNEPLVGALVTFTGIWLDDVTDENGYYYIDGIDPGTYLVGVDFDGYNSAFENVTIVEGTNYQDFFLTMLEEAYVFGHVYDIDTNAPLGDVLITWDEELTCTTQANGAYEMEELTPGDYDVTLELEGYETLHEMLELEAGETEQDFYMTSSGVVTYCEGYAYDAATNTPLVGALVTFTGIWVDDVTDENGYYYIDGIDPGTYLVGVDYDGYNSAFENVTIIEGANYQDFFLTMLEEAYVFGHVYDIDTNAPLGDVLITWDEELTCTTQLNGAYEMEELTPGDYDVTLELEGYDTLHEMLELEAGETEQDFYMTAVATDPVTLDLDPSLDVVPVAGGTIVYDATLVSTLGTSFNNVRYWTEVETPNGNVVGPLTTFMFNLQPFMNVTQPGLTQYVPPTAPSGTYYFTGYVGYFAGPYVSDTFSFTKIGATAGETTLEDWMPQVQSEGFSQVSTPAEFDLSAAYPNPFNAATTISVSLPTAADLSVAVFNVLGEQVAELHSGRAEAGVQMLSFDASDLSSGVYFVQATVPGQLSAIQKITLVK